MTKYKKIKLPSGKYTLVDAEDFEYLNQWKWHTNTNGGHVKRAERYGKGRSDIRNVLMHKELMQVPKGKEIDHINGNPLDNRKKNLRVATRAQNAWNTKAVGGSSKYKGVSWCKRSKKWLGHAVVNGKWHFIGYFVDERKAAQAMRAFYKEKHGEFASY